MPPKLHSRQVWVLHEFVAFGHWKLVEIEHYEQRWWSDGFENEVLRVLEPDIQKLQSIQDLRQVLWLSLQSGLQMAHQYNMQSIQDWDNGGKDREGDAVTSFLRLSSFAWNSRKIDERKADSYDI